MERNMMAPGTSSTAVSLLARALTGALVLAASSADAQSAVSSRASGVDGTLSAGAAVQVDPAAENVHCSGDLTINTKAVSDPSLPPGVVVSIDAGGLVCVGQGTRGRYVSDGQATLTRLLVASDVIKTTLAFHKNTPNGFLTARTALLTLSLTYDTTTGALTGATANLGDFLP
ncbi:MAG: hypothetical protein ACJ79R_19145 [Anaeromyxobacteraceae bacterium]